MQEKSGLRVRPKSLSDFTSSSGLFRKWKGGFARWSFRRDRVSVWDLLALKDIFQVLDQFLFLSRPAEREERLLPACLKNEK